MTYLVSRNWILPTSEDLKGSPVWLFHLWGTKQWPYDNLQVGDKLALVQTRRRHLLYEVRADRIERSSYVSHPDARDQINRIMTPDSVDTRQEHFRQAPKTGVLLAFRCSLVRNLDLPRPDNVKRLPRLGWVRDPVEIRRWGV